MLSEIHSIALEGPVALPVRIDVSSTSGLRFTLVGASEPTLRECQKRIRAALLAIGMRWPGRQITAAFSPADRRYEGASFDLPLALGVLLASGKIPSRFQKIWAMGEIQLNGQVAQTRGSAAFVYAAQKANAEVILLPHKASAEWESTEGVVFVENLRQAVDFFHTGVKPKPSLEQAPLAPDPKPFLWDSIKGQEAAKWSLLYAALGGHHTLLVGPPGIGKSLLAKSLGELISSPTPTQCAEILAIYSAMGRLDEWPGKQRRPFRAPHPSISATALVGGGHPIQPGEISLAHQGILFLDEWAEISSSALEALRKPLEEGEIRIGRAGRGLSFPARFQLIAATNACPCGPSSICHCSRSQIERYRRRFSGPLMDRMGIIVHLENKRRSQPHTVEEPEASLSLSQAKILLRNAQGIKEKRHALVGYDRSVQNCDVPLSRLLDVLLATPEALEVMDRASRKRNLSHRSVHQLFRLARTVADVEGKLKMSGHHVVKALNHFQQPM